MSRFVPVHLGDTVVHGVSRLADAALVRGHRVGADGRDRPVLARVEPDGRARYADLPGTGRVLTAWSGGEPSIDVTVLGPTPRHLLGDFAHGFEADDDTYFVRGAQAVWSVCGSEDPMYLTEWERGRLTGSDPVVASEPFPESPRLFRVGPRARLLVGQDRTGLQVAGLLRPGDSPAATPGLWRLEPWATSAGPAGWTRVPLAAAPDGFSSLRSGGLGTTLGGHRAGRPLLHTGTGARIEGPDVPLDPAHPYVQDVDLVLDGGDQGAPAPATVSGGSLVLQSAVEGPQLWTRRADGWTPGPLPAGRLVDADRPTATDELWVVVDGRLWREAA